MERDDGGAGEVATHGVGVGVVAVCGGCCCLVGIYNAVIVHVIHTDCEGRETMMMGVVMRTAMIIAVILSVLLLLH